MSSCIAYGAARDGHRITFPTPTENERMGFGQKLPQNTASQGTLSPMPVTIAPYVRSKKFKSGYTDTLYSFVSMARLLILSRPFSGYLSAFAHKTIGRWDCFVMKFKEMDSLDTCLRRPFLWE
jgi:hypothetical protein